MQRLEVGDDSRMFLSVVFRFRLFIGEIVKGERLFAALTIPLGDKLPVALSRGPIVSPVEVECRVLGGSVLIAYDRQ